MIMKHLSNLIAIMAASADGCTYDLDMPWPLHKALVYFASVTGREGGAGIWGFSVSLVDHSGLGVPEADGAVADLLREGRFIPDDIRPRRLLPAPDGQWHERRASMRLGVRTVEAVYRAARIWATAASTVSKNFEVAAESPGGTSRISPPNLLQVVGPAR